MRNLLKYTIGLPIILVFSIIFICVGIIFSFVNFIIYNEEKEDIGIYKELVYDLWRPIKGNKK